MDRIVRRLLRIPNKEQPQLERIHDFDDAANVILLGDPGAGKTHTFVEWAARCGGKYLRARQFLVAPDSQSDDILFIDALDEKRAGRTDRDTVDALAKKLFASAPSKVRISCRVADWLGDTDIAALQTYFELQGEPVVLYLDRLSPGEQAQILHSQGLEPGAASEFLSEAKNRGLEEFLDNPQNLIMLVKAVRAGDWPATRKQLFDLSTRILLQETDKSRARSGSGVFTVEELRPVAGAICASRLISDVEAISLTDDAESSAVPSYRSLNIHPPEQVSAALSRRIFEAAAEPESVDYTHRTSAEYLGAEWLANTIRNGLPLTRVRALMGIDGHPAPELRGLHAWLAVHLPEQANQIIDTDPYGVLTYGDAASLSQTACTQLLEALGKLSHADPWFRSGSWRSPAVGALSREDMVDQFRSVLRSSTAGFGVRSVVAEALAVGTPQPGLMDDLVQDFLRAQSPFSERLDVLTALLRIEPNGRHAVASATSQLQSDQNGLRLRAEAIRRMYGAPFGPSEVVQLLNDMLGSGDNAITGAMYGLAETVPPQDIVEILSDLPRGVRTYEHRRGQWEVARFVDRLVVRIWSEKVEVTPAQDLLLLQLRQSYAHNPGSAVSDDLRSAMQTQAKRLSAMAEHFFDSVAPDEDRWLKFNRFREISLFQIPPEQLAGHIIRAMASAPTGSNKQLFLYEAALNTTYAMDPPTAQVEFERLFAIADDRPDLQDVRKTSTYYLLPPHFFERDNVADDDVDGLDQTLNAFAQAADQIREGNHLGLLTWAAQIYYALFSDVDEASPPYQRLATMVGETNAKLAMEGFGATLSRPDTPSLADILTRIRQDTTIPWWIALLAGMTARWNSTPTLNGLADELLSAMIAYELLNPMHEQIDGISERISPAWKSDAMHERPQLVRDVYLSVARTKLDMRASFVDGLHELISEDALKAFRADVVIELLTEFPNAASDHLDELLGGVLTEPAAHARFISLAERVLRDPKMHVQQRDMWLCTAYLLAPTTYQHELEATATLRRGVVFFLRNHSAISRKASKQSRRPLLDQLVFLARLTGALFPDVSYPIGGWSGDTNAWDAAEYCRELINSISAQPTLDATDALRRLRSNAALASYNDHLNHALANQAARRREAEYDRPDWAHTIRALTNGEPATVADLHALLTDQLDDLRERLLRENTDLYKLFWNVDRYGRPTTPRPEETCRDALVALLRPRLAPLKIVVEPEGHMANDKRADIAVSMPARKILCELKRDYHADLWTAAEDQLERLYAHDPEAKGFAIYGVLYFGPTRPYPLPKHPAGLSLPTSAEELRTMLVQRLPIDYRNRIAVVVFDVSAPARPPAKSGRVSNKQPASKGGRKGKTAKPIKPKARRHRSTRKAKAKPVR